MTEDEYNVLMKRMVKPAVAQAKELNGNTKKPHKYNAVKTEIDGIKFDSKAEARRYQSLKSALLCKQIEDLRLKPTYQLIVNNQLICKYIPDFEYVEITASGGKRKITEDVKGMRTREYILKKKLMLAIHNIEVKEVK